jgi:hypothetical protein
VQSGCGRPRVLSDGTAVAKRFPPGPVVDIPANGLPDTCVEVDVRSPPKFVEDEVSHLFDTGLDPGTDVVGLADPAALQHGPDRAAVIDRVDPFAPVVLGPIDRQ